MGEGVPPSLLFGGLAGLSWWSRVCGLLDPLIQTLTSFNYQPAILRSVRCRRPRSLSRGPLCSGPGLLGVGLIPCLLLLDRIHILLKQNCVRLNSYFMQGFWWDPQTPGTYGLLDQEAACRVKPVAPASCPELVTNATGSGALFLPGAMRVSSL